MYVMGIIKSETTSCFLPNKKTRSQKDNRKTKGVNQELGEIPLKTVNSHKMIEQKQNHAAFERSRIKITGVGMWAMCVYGVGLDFIIKTVRNALRFDKHCL